MSLTSPQRYVQRQNGAFFDVLSVDQGGLANAFQIVALNASGSIDPTMLEGVIGGVLKHVSSYPATVGDQGMLHTFKIPGASGAYTLMNPPAPSGWFVFVENVGVSGLLVDPNGAQFDWVASSGIIIPQNQGIGIFSDGVSGYYSFRGMGGSGGSSSQTPLTGTFTVTLGATGNLVAWALAPRTQSTITKCKILTIASDSSIPLTINILKNGATIFSGSPPTVAASTSQFTVSTFTNLITNPLPVNIDDVFVLNISSGSAVWKCTIQLE